MPPNTHNIKLPAYSISKGKYLEIQGNSQREEKRESKARLGLNIYIQQVRKSNCTAENVRALTSAAAVKPVRSSVVFSPSAFVFSTALPPPTLLLAASRSRLWHAQLAIGVWGQRSGFRDINLMFFFVFFSTTSTPIS